MDLSRRGPNPSRTTGSAEFGDPYNCSGMNAPAIAPGVPADYYERIADVDERHWWYHGMLAIECALLGHRLERREQRLLDAGCGTGGMLRWALDSGRFAEVAGADLGSDAIELARRRVPEADLRVAPLRELPFADGSFDLIVSHDVLQHIHERELDESLRELHRVLAPEGALLLRTNGSRRLRRERDDWRAYDRAGLEETLRRGGFACERITYVNAVISLAAVVRGRAPHAPSETRHGVPPVDQGRLRSAVGRRLLAAETRWLSPPGRSLPFGHNLIAVAIART
jgi:SAM-dependent methyltransferase